jgi:hypothetical protein
MISRELALGRLLYRKNRLHPAPVEPEPPRAGEATDQVAEERLSPAQQLSNGDISQKSGIR